MVNGNYVLYGERPSSESEIVDDHVQARTIDRKNKRKVNRTANELQKTLSLAQLDNETDSIKYEKKVKEPRLLRYVSTQDVEENYVTEKFETYDLKATVERPRRYTFQKKPKNIADGSVNYACSHSSSSCSSPNGNLPTISEHGEQYGTYRVHDIPSPTMGEIINGYEPKIDPYFNPKEKKKYPTKGSHPDSLYKIPNESAMNVDKLTKVLRLLRWPIALIAACVALGIFIYFLMPDNIDKPIDDNGTYYQSVSPARGIIRQRKIDGSTSDAYGAKTAEMDFYDNENESEQTKIDFTRVIDTVTEKIPASPVFPTHISPEVQYGNERADSKLRTAKTLNTNVPNDSTLKPHITNKAEKPLAIYLNDANEGRTTESITRAETINKYLNYAEKPAIQNIAEAVHPTKHNKKQFLIETTAPVIQELTSTWRDVNANFTSGHSKLFGISIEDAERMQSTTQNSLYNTRVSPTLPTWRDDTTTKNYPVNINYEAPLCRSTSLSFCRDVLPYDLASSPVKINGVEVTTLLPQIEYLVATNCSDRLKQFACALMEPECNAPPQPAKLPCQSLCKVIADSCEGLIPRELAPIFHCKKFPSANCIYSNMPCFGREFSCGDGLCIPKHWRCDGNKDCLTGEDELACVECNKNEFRCEPGVCIPKRWLCDGYADCPKGQDEAEGCDYIPGDPGEEPSGSAPAPAIRLPNSLRKTIETDNSKELLVTSDSGNALRRNFTSRRPSPSRLKPYPARKTVIVTESVAETTPQNEMINVVFKTTQKPQDEDEEKQLIDFKKIRTVEQNIKSKSPQMVPPQSSRTQFAPDPIEFTSPPSTRLDKSISKLEKVINGAALLKKALSENQTNDSTEMNTANSFEATSNVTTSHVSPCPSDELRCVDGRCITLAQLCDGTIDCTDHADEDNCYT